MTLGYPTRVGARKVLTGLSVAALAVAGLIALSYWLLPPAATVETIPAPADSAAAADADASPGAIDCPRPSEVDRQPTPLDVASSALIDCPDVYGGRTVTYTGEAIGTIFPHGDRAVVTLNDDDYALEAGPLPKTRTALGGNSGLAVVLPAGVAQRVEVLGDYAHRGALVQVAGRYESASELLGGEPAIVADTATVIDAGYAVEHDVAPRTAVAAALAAFTALATAVLTRRRL